MYRHPRVLSVSCLVVSALLLAATLLQVAGPVRYVRPAPGVMVRVRGRRGRWRVSSVDDEAETVRVDPLADADPWELKGARFNYDELEPVDAHVQR